MVKIIKGIFLKLLDMIYVFRGIVRFLDNFLKGRYHSFIDNKKQEEVLILGNGPSLNELDLVEFKNRKFKMVCVNYFPSKNDCFFEIKPDFLCVLDGEVFNNALEENKELYTYLEKVDWNMKVITYTGCKFPIINSCISYEWINGSTIMSKNPGKIIFWLYKKNVLGYCMQNVVLGALYYFISCNYKKIYLAGIDMSEFKNIYVDEDNRPYVDTVHSYGTRRIYYDESINCGLNKMYQILQAYQKMFEGYNQAKEYADYSHIDVFNLSINSYVDSFDKISPEKFTRLNNLIYDSERI